MGLDLALGAMILLGAIRGWFKGFVTQTVRIGGFVACFYLADPVRDHIRPFVLSRVPAIDASLMDRILWWVSAVISYIVLVGVTTLAIQLLRTPSPPGAPKSRRDDRFGGSLLGAAKALLIAALIAAGIQKYGPDLIRAVPWAERQTSASYALQWSEKYQIVPRIWAAPPVRRFVEHIERNGLRGPVEAVESKQVAERTSKESEQTGWLPHLDLPQAEQPIPDPPRQESGLGADFDREIEDIKAELREGPHRP